MLLEQAPPCICGPDCRFLQYLSNAMLQLQSKERRAEGNEGGVIVLPEAEEAKRLRAEIHELTAEIDGFIRSCSDYLSREFVKWWHQHLAKYRGRVKRRKSSRPAEAWHGYRIDLSLTQNSTSY
jgi:hypothetical protein